MDIAEGECSIDGSSAAHLPSENLPHLACWSGLACRKFEFHFQQPRQGTGFKLRAKDLSGLASTSVRQLLETSCLVQPAQMSEAPSTSSLEVLKGQ